MKRRINSSNALLRISLKRGSAHPEGDISGMLLPEKIHFEGYTDLIMKIDRIYDLLDYQTSSEKIRHYGEAGKDRWSETPLYSSEDWGKAGDISAPLKPAEAGAPVIYLYTLYRKNMSWQGYIRLMSRNERKEIPFRSVLELMYILEDFWMEISQRQAG